MRAPLRTLLLRLLIGSAVSATLVGIYLEYLNPHVIVEIATRFWSCF
jgi:hypothetical membrane protein